MTGQVVLHLLRCTYSRFCRGERFYSNVVANVQENLNFAVLECFRMFFLVHSVGNVDKAEQAPVSMSEKHVTCTNYRLQ